MRRCVALSKAVFPPVALVVALALTGCGPDISAADREALDDLAAVAGPTSDVSADAVTDTECWLPSEHPVEDAGEEASDSLWRVICRVHYEDATGDRYKDTTCLGDFALDPMLERCYRWTHYDFAPRFEDHPAVDAG